MTYRPLVCVFVFCLGARLGLADDIAAELSAAATDLATAKYRLAYKFQPGEEIVYDVQHLATVDTKIDGHKQVTKSTTDSTKKWKVTKAEDGQFTFVYSVERVKLWKNLTGREDVRFDSATDEAPPEEYKSVVSNLNKPLATVTIDGSGEVIKRDSAKATPDLGFGQIVLPLPKQEVALKQTWKVPKKHRLTQKDGRVKQVLTQVRYRLEKVKSGVATISVKTQVLTPLNDATLKSQLVQQLSNGEVKFDLDAGRVISRQLDWAENVIGFNGPGSNMKYLARFTERLRETRTAQKSVPTKR